MERVRAAADAVRAFGVVPAIMDVLVREHFLTAIRRLGLIDSARGGAMPAAVAFVDLDASTALVNRLDSRQLAGALADFERTAFDAAVANDCRVVKMIGDEAMIAGTDARAVVDVVRAIVSFVGTHEQLGSARGGIATGDALARDGDYFGPVVNLAARLAKVAVPGETLATPELVDAAGLAGCAEPAGDYELKGFAAPVAVMRLRLG